MFIPLKLSFKRWGGFSYIPLDRYLSLKFTCLSKVKICITLTASSEKSTRIILNFKQIFSFVVTCYLMVLTFWPRWNRNSYKGNNIHDSGGWYIRKMIEKSFYKVTMLTIILESKYYLCFYVKITLKYLFLTYLLI